MTSTPQIAPDVQSAPILSKSMKGKYDGRGPANRLKAKKLTGRKPAFAKHLSRNTAAVVLSQVDLKARLLELLTHPDARLRFEVIRYVWDRLEGKPFVAENPQTTGRSNMLLQDNRIQVAIQQLVPAKQARKSKKAKQIEANSEAKQLVSGDAGTQTYVDATAQVVDSGQDVSE
jgi:hypothetical protein